MRNTNKMKMRTPLLAIAALSLTAAATPWIDDLAFGPADDTKVVREHSFEADFELGDISIVVDGNDLSENVPGDFEASLETNLEVSDHFVSSGDGRALDLIRTRATQAVVAGGEER